MKRLIMFVVFSLTIFACSPIPAASQSDQPSSEPVIETQELVVLEPTATPVPTETPVTALPFEAITYRDESAGFEFDYPVGWAFDGGEQQSRGSYVQFYSWDWKPGDPIEPMPEGGTVLTVTNQLWDPKNDLEAFINQRKLAWDASGISILSEEHIILDGERSAGQFIVQGADGTQSFYLLTTNGENYLVLSGNGNLDLLAQIAHTLHPIQ